MNKLFILISIIFFFLPCFSQGDSQSLFYYAFDEKVGINVVDNKYVVALDSNVDNDIIDESIKKIIPNAKTARFNNSFCFIVLDHIINEQEKKSVLNIENISRIDNVYTTNDGLEVFLGDDIVIHFKEGVSESIRENVLEKFNLYRTYSNEIFETVCPIEDEYVLSVANRLFETGLFEFSYPTVYSKIELLEYDVEPLIPTDLYFQYQRALHNTGQEVNGHYGTYDADIDAPEAWTFTTGSENIVVAVFDEGVTSNHSDLPNTRQVRLNGSNFGAGNPNDPSPVGDGNHGNACAGVIGASMNNYEGIVGIAPDCKIMPLRWDENSSLNDMANGIKFAVNNGAKVISNSWGIYTRNNLSPALISAIVYALGHGVVVVFASGNTASHANNDDGYVLYPANANLDGVLVVGASDRDDYQADYSPSSSIIDVVAPSHKAYPSDIAGETLEMWTIDIPYFEGYNPWPLNPPVSPPYTGDILPSTGHNQLSYTGHFGGTSYACPVVAGVAALLLSMDSLLTPFNIYDIITGTADKIGGYYYSNGRCNETGYGRVNAFKALKSLCTYRSISNTNFLSNTSVSGCEIEFEDVEVFNNSRLSVQTKGYVQFNGLFTVNDDCGLIVRKIQ